MTQAHTYFRDKPFALAGWITMALAILTSVLWPGDVGWGIDISFIIVHALKCNQGFGLAGRGLQGSFPINYGPFPTHFYQLLLLFTHDLRTLVMMRAIFCSSLMAGSLLWLGKTLRLTPWVATVVVIAPTVLSQNRTPWDCSFLIPIGTLAVGAYASFLRKHSRASLVTALTAAVLVPLIHPMGCPLFISIAGHAACRYRPRFWESRKPLAAALCIVAVFNSAYLFRSVKTVVTHAGPLFGSERRQITSHLQAALGPLHGGNLLDADGLSRFFPNSPHLGNLLDIMAGMGSFLVWAGMACAIIQHMRRLVISPPKTGTRVAGRDSSRQNRADGKEPQDESGPAFGESSTAKSDQVNNSATRDTLSGIALSCLVLQVLLMGALRCPPFPHYNFGMFPFLVFFAWLAVDMLGRIRLTVPVVALWGLSSAIVTFGGMWHVHVDGRDRSPVVIASLTDLMTMADTLNGYSNPIVWSDVPVSPDLPIAISCMRQVHPPDTVAKGLLAPHGLLLRFQPACNPKGSRLEIIPMHSATDLPADAKPVDLGFRFY